MAGRNEGRSIFKLERGDSTKEGSLSPSRKDGSTEGAPGWDAQSIKHQAQTPFLNPDPFNWWYGIKNVARVRVNWESCMAVLGNGAQIKTIMPGFMENHSLDVRPISDFIGRWVVSIGLGNALTWPIGYVIIWVQVDLSPGLWWGSDSPCNPRLVQPCSSGPCNPRNPMIGCIMNVIKESEIDMLVKPWVNAWVTYLLAVWWATTTVDDDKVPSKILDSTGYDEIVTTKDSKMIDALSSKIIHARTKPAFTGARLNIMTQTLCAEEGSLPQGLMIQNTFTDMWKKSVTIIVRNDIAYPQTLKNIPVARVVATNHVPEVQIWSGTMEALDGVQGIQTPKMTIEQR